MGLRLLHVPGVRRVSRYCKDVTVGLVDEEHLLDVGRNGKFDVGAVSSPTRAVVLGPTLVDGGLGLVIPRGNAARGKDVDPVAVRVFEPRNQAVRLPIT